jgi:hypothetical protein
MALQPSRTRVLLLVSLGLVGVAGWSVAGFPGGTCLQTIFQTTFDNENGGSGQLNYNGFHDFTVASGSVDLIGNGFYDVYESAHPNSGHHLYVDMDGSTNQAGMLTHDFVARTGGTTLLIDVAGSQRPLESPSDALTIRYRDLTSLAYIFSQTFTLNANDPFTNQAVGVTAVQGQQIQLQIFAAGGDNAGPLIDNAWLCFGYTPPQ